MILRSTKSTEVVGSIEIRGQNNNNNILAFPLLKIMEFNSEQTLKEVNVSWLTNIWKFGDNTLWVPKKCMDVNCGFGYTTRYFLFPELYMNSTILGKHIINYKKKICVTIYNDIS